MTTPVGVLAIGAAAPSLRLRGADVGAAWGGSGRGQIAVCGPDEDVLTLSWTAATDAIAAAGLEPADIDALFWGTSRPPFAEGPSFAFLAGALSLPATVGGVLTSGSAHAGMDALLAGWDAIAAGSARAVVVVAGDAVVPGLGTTFEGRAGAAAIALVLSNEGGSARLVARSTRTRPVLDRYRGDGERGLRDIYDGRLFREEIYLPEVTAVAAALDGDATAWSLPDPDGRLAATAARRLGGTLASADTYTALGDTGAAAALLGATNALTAAGRAHVVAMGGGRTTAVALEVADEVAGARAAQAVIAAPGREASYAEVLRVRGELVPSGETVAMAVPPGSAQFVRGAEELLGLLGARCVDCGMISTPPSIHPVCVGCGGSKLEPTGLARSGSVHTFVVNHTMPAPFVAPLPLVVADLDDGARIMLQGITEDASALAIGDRVDLVLRKYAHERGVPVYGYKVKRLVAS